MRVESGEWRVESEELGQREETTYLLRLFILFDPLRRVNRWIWGELVRAGGNVYNEQNGRDATEVNVLG